MLYTRVHVYILVLDTHIHVLDYCCVILTSSELEMSSVFSTITTVSAPSGRGAPVVILETEPGVTCTADYTKYNS